MKQKTMDAITEQFHNTAILFKTAMAHEHGLMPYVDAVNRELEVIANILAQIPIEDKADE